MPSFPQPGLERRWKKLPGQPDGDAGDPYTGYDRFGRTERMLWGRPQEAGGFEMLVDVQWGYDRASLKTWRKDLLAPAATNQDQHFGYDGLYQVTQRQRGLLNTSTTAIGGVPAQQEGFGYDETGNWVSYRQANAGALDIDQSRANNRSNQIAQVDGSSAGVSYDRNGNMLTVPTGEALTGAPRKLVWDAWNRLREVRDEDDSLIASYQYDAATRRTVETTGEGEPAVTRHFYYNDQWRSVEERLDTSTQPERQQVWHPADGYELLLRDRSTGNDGELDERLYPMKDQLDPVAVCDATGTVVERYAYSAFGMTTFLNPSFIPQPSSLVAWNFLFHAEFADPTTRWFNYGYRYYLPELGRWPSRDPIGEEGGLNLYRMIGNDCLSRTDFMGMLDPGGRPVRPITTTPRPGTPGGYNAPVEPGYGPGANQAIGQAIIDTIFGRPPKPNPQPRPKPAFSPPKPHSWIYVPSSPNGRVMRHYTNSDLTGQRLRFGSHATTLDERSCYMARARTGAHIAVDCPCWKCIVTGPSDAFTQLPDVEFSSAAFLAGADNYYVIGLVQVTVCLKLPWLPPP